MPYAPRPFVGDIYEPRIRLGDYARAEGLATAEAIRRNGANNAALWSGIGQNVSGTLRDIAAYPEQQRAAARQAEMQRRDDEAYQQEQAAKNADQAKAERLRQLSQEFNGQRIPTDALLKNFDPADAAKIDAYQEKLFPTPKAPEPFTLNPGDVRFDGAGKQIASVPKPQEPEPTITVETVDDKGRPVTRVIPKSQAVGQSFPKPIPREPQGPQPSWQWVTRNGKEVYTNRVMDGDTPNTNRVKATEDERKTAGFYGQMSDAIALMDSLENQITDKELYQIQSLPQEGLIGMMNRGELSEAAKRYVRAFEQFTEARLRPVSGAAISDSEFARDRRTYAKQFKETPALNKDRRSARNRALDSLKKRAGVALDDANAPVEKKNPNR